MFDLGWSELLIIGVAALIVVGPKDLPRMLRTLGRYAARAKSVARDFQRAMDDAARQADIEELKEVRKDLDAVRADTYKIQREMGQSFLDGPGKSKKAGEGKAAESEPAESKPAESKPAEPKPAAEPAPAPQPAADAGPGAGPAAPEAEGGKAGGA